MVIFCQIINFFYSLQSAVMGELAHGGADLGIAK
jgi:hypothetical protein